MRGITGLIILGIIIFGIWYLASSGYVSNFLRFLEVRKKGGDVYFSGINRTLANLRLLYENFEKSMEIIANPEKIYLQAQESKPMEDVLRNEYRIEIYGNVFSKYLPYEVQKSQDGITANFLDAIYMYRISARVNQPVEIEYSCYFRNSIPKCVNTTETYNGIIKVHRFISKAINCKTKPKFNFSNKDCLHYLSYGFYVDSNLRLKFNLSTYTLYKALVVNSNILEKAMIENKNIYDFLGLGRDYDIGKYKGVPGYPKLNIDRLNRREGYPIVYFGNSISDVIIVELKPISNIERINNFVIKFYPEVKFVDENGKCSNSAIYNYAYFNVTCSNNVCYISNIKYWGYYKKNNYRMSLFIPICIDKKIEEYAELLINASVSYTYVTGKSLRIYYRKV